ncbi:bifunctional nicotinamide-nucleotide adenylyltransferase/Nudix hydroxylase [Comamonas sp. NoAH]|uniref:bifunctional nicotinamide-nucleotide adenylyltransferase/Nudix hydroxylase n=1 Tax=Comamonas halotolerans TaxID=3041496 RepID=UPI0024E04C0F|nr:bifunctional nicotinamide-nucleotide adenylyltransferase/Nudix hydroxylase [Comamonas sp. NoAH]
MSQTEQAPHTAVLIGRFQPFHNGHLALLRQALQAARQVVVVLGSAWQARSPKNPFTWQERAHLIHSSLSHEESARVRCVPVRDYYDEPRWVQAVMTAVQIEAPKGATIALVGHFKDDSSNYLARFPGWQLLSLSRQGDFDGTPIREIYWNLPDLSETAKWDKLRQLLPPAVADWLLQWQATPDYTGMQAEWRMISNYKAAWAAAPYPPVFVTVDGLLLCNDHVLLIQRGHAPGKDLWALPGGFVEPRDTLWQSCLRELDEETGLPLTQADMRKAWRGTEVFDHPDRSLRGRTITHVFVFHLPGSALPSVHAGDDAARARWVPLSDLAEMESQMFEDHFHVLRRCFAQFGSGPRPALL